MKDFRDLKVWEKAHRLTLDIYEVTRRFPREDLWSELRRGGCSASIAANLTEGLIDYDILVKQLGELGRMLTSLILKVDLEPRRG